MNFGRWLGYEHIRNNNEAENHIIFSKINTKKKKKKKYIFCEIKSLYSRTKGKET